jgi:hypothetical protein
MKQTWVILLAIVLIATVATAATAQTRPQDPVPPFPYQAIEVSYDNVKAPGVRLGGTLVIPSGKPPFPAVLLITGSGQQDRDEAIFNHRPFAVIADYLARRGIASLRVDDRGIGSSTGPVEQATSADFATDVEAGIAFLRSRPQVSSQAIGLIGHSEGGMIAPMVATVPQNQVAFIVLLAAPGVPGDRLLLEQQRALLKASGTSDKDITAQSQLLEKLLPMIKASQESTEVLTDRLIAIVKQMEPDAPEVLLRQQISFLTLPWMRFFLAYDPAPVLARVTCPVLALNGEKDLQVLADTNLPAIEQALQQAGHPKFKVVKLAGLNHLFQTAKTGAPEEYERIDETFSPKALQLIADWIDQTIRSSKSSASSL